MFGQKKWAEMVKRPDTDMQSLLGVGADQQA